MMQNCENCARLTLRESKQGAYWCGWFGAWMADDIIHNNRCNGGWKPKEGKGGQDDASL